MRFKSRRLIGLERKERTPCISRKDDYFAFIVKNPLSHAFHVVPPKKPTETNQQLHFEKRRLFRLFCKQWMHFLSRGYWLPTERIDTNQNLHFGSWRLLGLNFKKTVTIKCMHFGYRQYRGLHRKHRTSSNAWISRIDDTLSSNGNNGYYPTQAFESITITWPPPETTDPIQWERSLGVKKNKGHKQTNTFRI